MSTVTERLREALNSHDPDQVASLFAQEYRSSQPAHPGREFTGRAQVRENWTSVFAGVPDFSAVLVSLARDGDVEYSEWDWRGTHPDGSSFAMRGVTVVVVRDDLIAEARLYMEAVDVVEKDIDAAVQELYRPPRGSHRITGE